MLLNLRQDADAYGDTSQSQGKSFPVPVFAENSLIGNLGAPLRTEEDEDGGDDFLGSIYGGDTSKLQSASPEEMTQIPRSDREEVEAL